MKPDLLLGSVSGGTDVCTAFVGSCPLLPVHAGELQCAGLGAKVEAFDRRRTLGDRRGRRARPHRAACRRCRSPSGTTPTASATARATSRRTPASGGTATGSRSRARHRRHLRPLRLDAEPRRRAHGHERVLPRRRRAARESRDSLVVDTGRSREPTASCSCSSCSRTAIELDDALEARRSRTQLRTQLSPRHVPDVIVAVPAIPRTLNGKKLEVPVKRLFQGEPPDNVASPDTLADPAAFDAFVALADELAPALTFGVGREHDRRIGPRDPGRRRAASPECRTQAVRRPSPMSSSVTSATGSNATRTTSSMTFSSTTAPRIGAGSSPSASAAARARAPSTVSNATTPANSLSRDTAVRPSARCGRCSISRTRSSISQPQTGVATGQRVWNRQPCGRVGGVGDRAAQADRLAVGVVAEVGVRVEERLRVRVLRVVEQLARVVPASRDLARGTSRRCGRPCAGRR